MSIKIDGNCVITENIHTPHPHGEQPKFRGEGEFKRRQFPRGNGWLLEVLFPGTPIKIGELLKINSCSVEQNYQLFHC